MPFTQESFPFVLPFGSPTGSLTSPLLINYAYPGAIFNGSETNGITAAIYENVGDIWMVTNAALTNGVWSQPNPLLPSQAFVLRGATAQYQVLTAGAGQLPSPGWTSPSSGGGGGSGTIGINTLQWGLQTSVPADGSGEVTVSYGSPFASSISGITATIVNAFQTHPWQLTVQTNTAGLTSFKLNVAGAPPGSTVNVFWMAIGS